MTWAPSVTNKRRRVYTGALPLLSAPIMRVECHSHWWYTWLVTNRQIPILGAHNYEKIIAGMGFELTGVSMLLCSSLIASLGMENTTEWHTELGRYWQTVSNMGLLPVLIIGAVLLTAGVILSLWGAFSKSDNKSI